MAKKKTKKPTPLSSDYRPNIEVESRQAVAITVAWMLSTVSGTLATVCWLAAYGIVAKVSPPGRPSPIAIIPNSLWFIAFLTGVLSLIFLPAVYRWRKVPPPLSVVVYSVLVAVTPVVGLGVLWLINQMRNG